MNSMSPPAQNARPAPVMTTTRQLASSSAERSANRSSSRMVPPKAFNLSGRLSVMAAIAPRSSYSMCDMAAEFNCRLVTDDVWCGQGGESAHLAPPLLFRDFHCRQLRAHRLDDAPPQSRGGEDNPRHVPDAHPLHGLVCDRGGCDPRGCGRGPS